jgi:signal transduction histidine kinase
VALDAKVERMASIFDVDVAIYDQSGKRLADFGKPIAPLDEVPLAPSLKGRGRTQEFAVPIASGRAYIVGTYAWSMGNPLVWLLIPAVVLLVLALVSVPMARGIARPVERITRAARALGRGDLTARTGIDSARKDELGELARSFDEMASRLERMVRNEKELLANVSHELRTPLSRIRVALELAEDAGDRATFDKHLHGIGGDLAELEELVTQVLLTTRLDLAHSKDAGMPIERAPTLLADVVHESARRFEARHDSRRLEIEVEDDMPVVELDSKLVRRLLDNLLDNAAKYSDDSAGAIVIRATVERDELSLVVADRGIGVAAADLPMIFEPFFRTDRSRERGTGGVGLGLALCARIADAHGGRIDARPRDGGGLEIHVRLPLRAPA